MSRNKSSLIRALSGIILALTAWGLFRLSQVSEGASRILRSIGLSVGSALCRLWSIFPFPVSELVWIVGIALALALVITMTVKHKKDGFIRALSHLMLTGGVMALMFSGIFLVQYSAPPISESLGITVSKYSVQQLADTTRTVAELLNREAELVQRDEDGLFLPADFDTLAASVQDSYKNGSMAELWVRGSRLSPKKAILLSEIMNYLGITGYYFPLTGESIVGGNLIETTTPFTIAHETAHSFGIGPEKEANFAAFLCGVESLDHDVRYGCLFNGFIYLNNALYRADKELWREVYSTLSDSVRADLSAKTAHLDKYETPVKEVGTTVNDTYIKATGQPDGVKSYGLMVDLIIAYYNK